MVAELLEARPREQACITLQLEIPVLSDVSEVIRGQPNLVSLGRPLTAEELFTLADPRQWALLAIIGREFKFVIARNA